MFGALLLALPSAPSAAVETKGEMIPGTIPEFVQSFLAVTCLSGARTSFPEVSSRLIIIDGDGVPRHLEEFIAWSAGVRNNGSGITRECTCSLPKNTALMIFVFITPRSFKNIILSWKVKGSAHRAFAWTPHQGRPFKSGFFFV